MAQNNGVVNISQDVEIQVLNTGRDNNVLWFRRTDGDEDDLVLSSYLHASDSSTVFVARNVLHSDEYYALIDDDVCPQVMSRTVKVDAEYVLPTAFTPYVKDGLNDDFMRGCKISIFNQFGMKVFEGNDGWDGQVHGDLAYPGVYYYSVTLPDGSHREGSVEVVRFR